MNEFIESREEMEQLLQAMTLGCLGVTGESSPYVVPLNYAYVNGRILFHCALEGQKLDAIRRNPAVCFTVARQSGSVQDHGAGELCHADSDSVICYGIAREIEDQAERQVLLDEFNHVFRPDAEEISLERTMSCAAVEITVTDLAQSCINGKGR